MQQTKQLEAQEHVATRPKAMAAAHVETPMSQMNLDNTVFAFTRIIWLNKALETMQGICMEPMAREMFEKYCKTTTHLYQYHFDFLSKYAQVASAQVCHVLSYKI